MLAFVLLTALQAQPVPPPTTPETPPGRKHQHQISGTVSGITLTARVLSVQARGGRGGGTRAIQVNVPRECTITVDGKTGALADLKDGMRVRITSDTALGRSENSYTASRIVAHTARDGEPDRPPATGPGRSPDTDPGPPAAQPPRRAPATPPEAPRRLPLR